MADERDPQVSARYRELGAEEPPEALDQAILAASRRDRAKRQRWYFGLAAAAVLLLAVAVTVQMEPRPDPESVAARSGGEIPREELPQRASPPLSAPISPPASAPRPQQAPLETAQKREERAADAAVQAKPMARLAETPEQWLERIAQLRKEGRSEEADRQLAEFRKRYPDYPIPDKK